MVVSAQHYRAAKAAIPNSVVESACDLDAPLSISIQDSRLRADYQLVLLCSPDPLNVVCHLLLDLWGRTTALLLQAPACDVICAFQIDGVSATAYPAEGAKAIVEEER